jgi:tetratricopeptide (TPR) repeat protein
MTKGSWTAFPYDAASYTYTSAELKKRWARLHAGDAEPFPKETAVLQAWALFHAGKFQKAVAAGLAAGGGGICVANKAQAIYAHYLEPSETRKLELFLEVAQRAEGQQAERPKCANAYYWQAYALGRYAQGISVAKVLTQDLGSKVRNALETTIKLAPRHADAHIALGAFHAEVIDKVGSLLGKAEGASKEAGLRMFKEGLRLNPASAIARIEYAQGLMMLQGEQGLEQAERLYHEAAECEPADAMERLEVEMARADLEE